MTAVIIKYKLIINLFITYPGTPELANIFFSSVKFSSKLEQYKSDEKTDTNTILYQTDKVDLTEYQYQKLCMKMLYDLRKEVLKNVDILGEQK